MVNTKMELDVHDDKIDELELILQVLNGTHDLNFNEIKAQKGFLKYPVKNPEEVVADYLTKVFGHLKKALAIPYFDYETQFKGQIPVDIVITIPVACSLYLTRSVCISLK